MADIHNEAGVKREVRKLLAKYGWFVWMPPSNGYGKAGISDFHALKDGTFLAIETKYSGNSATTLQARFLTDVTWAGGEAMIVHEKNLEDLKKLLENL